ncbi:MULTISPECIES: hemerythrin domain-containing protein [unclassified Leptolyngbya]|uniref:hemerythrin domain-containing protein n=1 Tax=unclassified Leptolyngbya TaxID=2650499 RepID=UPI001684D022|nr:MULTISPECIES: hemerythrin domain-containing protein [unclassified Leptolyngbya]MBD1909396.1 hemerythrin domain-containing protein [Leptolyngbya sp. FACHB-8]MBD2157113.1 hemerythrin domain-containing protein [Leptolyngbya sp. FACHB-16]
MFGTIDDTKRIAIAVQLAEMKAFQNLLISNERVLMDAVEDGTIRQQLQAMLEQDQKNLGVLDSTITQYGIQGKLSTGVEENLNTIQGYMENSDFPLAEKVFRHELLKHQQTMAGEVIHKAAQIIGADVAMAIAPLHTINFENRAHQEQLKGILEILGVQELTGQSPDQGFWGRSGDAIAALTGVVGSVVTRTDDEMSIRDLLLMDHSKTDVLFAEILGSDNPQKIQEYFGQLYQDVKVHGLAEEQVLYPAVQPYYDQMQEIVDQTDHVIEMLDAMKPLDPAAPDFKAQVEQLRLAVRGHIDQEESDVFPKLKDNFDHEQQKQLATEFKAAKSKLQKQQAQPSEKRPVSSQTQPNQSSGQERMKTGFIFLNQTAPWKLVFQSKAVINWFEAVVFLLGDRWIRTWLQTEPLVNSEYSQLFYGLVFIIGIGYWWVSNDIQQNHGIVRLGILIQSSVFLILAYHTLLGNLHPLYLVSGVLDLIFAILFSIFLYSSRFNLRLKKIQPISHN